MRIVLSCLLRLLLLAFLGVAKFGCSHAGSGCCNACCCSSPHVWTSGSPLANLTLFPVPNCHSSFVEGLWQPCILILLQVKLILKILSICLWAGGSLCTCVFCKSSPINTRSPLPKVTSETLRVNLFLNWKSLVAPNDNERIGTPELS